MPHSHNAPPFQPGERVARQSLPASRTFQGRERPAGGTGLAPAPAAASGLSSAHIPTPAKRKPPSVEYSPEGSYLRLRRPTGQQIGGGTRGQVVGFSDGARGRMLDLVNSVDRSQVPDGRAIFVTLTYHLTWPSPRDTKRDLDTFLHGLKRRHPECSGIWKLEPQSRGAPHFHLMVFMPGAAPLDVPELNAWAAQA